MERGSAGIDRQRTQPGQGRKSASGGGRRKGKEGQNVRLAAKVSGWKIDIKSHSQFLAAQESAADIVELDEDDVDAMEDYRAESETTESAEMAEPAAPAETADAEALTETCAAEPQAEEITFVEE